MAAKHFVDEQHLHSHIHLTHIHLLNKQRGQITLWNDS